MVLAFIGQPKHYTETFMRRWGAKRDSNENAIVDALEAIGVYVVRLNQPAMPDLLCWTQREGLRLIEVKMPGQKLNVLQQTTRRYLPFAVVTSEAEALALFGVTS
jgi:Holliday junction resolvase